MPTYMLLLRDDVTDAATALAEFQAYFQRFVSWADALHRDGRLAGVERLESEGGRTVRRREGRIVVDGPFAEGKEAVLGFFLVEAEDDDAAARLAADCPSVSIGNSVEVRRVGSFPKPGSA